MESEESVGEIVERNRDAAVKAKVELYQAAFQELYNKEVEDIRQIVGSKPQVSQAAIEDLQNIVHRQLFGHGHDQEGKEVP